MRTQKTIKDAIVEYSFLIKVNILILEKVALLIASPERLVLGESKDHQHRDFQSKNSKVQYFQGSIWSSGKPREQNKMD